MAKFKKIFFAYTYIALLVGAFMVVFIYIILPMLPITRRHYKDYSTFLSKTRSHYLASKLPDSAEPEYYYHPLLFNKQSGYRVQLSDDDYKRMKEDSMERYLSQKDSHEKNGTLYIGKSTEAPDYSKLKTERLGFVKNKLIRSDDGFYLLYDFIINSSESDYRFGMLCNDQTNEIVEYYLRIAKPT